MHVASIRSLVLARDDVTLRYCGVAYIAVGIVDAMQIMSSAIFTHGLSPRPSSLVWTRELKQYDSCIVFIIATLERAISNSVLSDDMTHSLSS